jgi:regulatory protein
LKTVTDVKGQKKDGRVSVFLDESFWFGTSIEAASDLGLRPGLKLNEEKLQEIEEAVVQYQALDRTIHFLGYRLRTEAEIRKKLSGEYSEDIIDQTVQKLYEYSYLDDQLWASEMVRSAREIGKGEQWLREKAWKAGLEGQVLKEAIAQDYPHETQVESVVDYCQSQKISFESWEDRNRIWRRLAGRGFHPSVINEALDKISS